LQSIEESEEAAKAVGEAGVSVVAVSRAPASVARRRYNQTRVLYVFTAVKTAKGAVAANTQENGQTTVANRDAAEGGGEMKRAASAGVNAVMEKR